MKKLSDWSYFYDTTWKCYTVTWCGWSMAHCGNLNKAKECIELMQTLEK